MVGVYLATQAHHCHIIQHITAKTKHTSIYVHDLPYKCSQAPCPNQVKVSHLDVFNCLS